MTFVQIIDCKTDRVDDMNQLMDTWVARTGGKRTATHSIIGRDRGDASHYVEIVEFPSYEEAVRNADLPETNEAFQNLVGLCEEPPRFTDLEVVRDEPLNTATVRRLFEEIYNEGNLDAVDEVFAADYREHDPANEQEITGIEGVRGGISQYRDAFDLRFTIDDLLAAGDQVATRWTCRGTHRGDFRGVKPSGKEFSVTGLAIHKLRDGKIQEGWWNWDTLGLMRGLGIVEERGGGAAPGGQ